jgi:hypothetical protein
MFRGLRASSCSFAAVYVRALPERVKLVLPLHDAKLVSHQAPKKRKESEVLERNLQDL